MGMGQLNIVIVDIHKTISIYFSSVQNKQLYNNAIAHT